MSLRQPPRIAAWLLRRFVTFDRRDSLLGDLFEEFQTGRTRGWYWRETLTALLIHARREARALLAEGAARASLVLAALSACMFVLLQQYRQRCPSLPFLLSGSAGLTTCAALAGVAIAVVLRLGSLQHPIRAARRRGLLRLSVAAFAAVGFGAGAATWAGTSSCAHGERPYPGRSAEGVLVQPDVPPRQPGACTARSSECRSR